MHTVGHPLFEPLRRSQSRRIELLKHHPMETLATQAAEYDRWATVSDTNGDG